MKKQSFLRSVFTLILLALIVPAVSAHEPTEGRTGRAEVRFLEGMIDHHQMALDMAEDCLAKASTETVTTLCQNVIDAQSAEIELMQGWLLEWYNIAYSPMPMSEMTALMESEESDHSGHHGSEEVYTDPAMMMGMFAGFNRLEGVDYEIAWLESMVDHHDDAIHMSERLLERLSDETGHTELSELAQQVIDDQTAEIESMEALLVELDS